MKILLLHNVTSLLKSADICDTSGLKVLRTSKMSGLIKGGDEYE